MRGLVVLLLVFGILHITMLPSHGLEKSHRRENILLTPADQLILDRIDKMSRETNARFEKIDEKFDNMSREINARFEKIDEKFDNMLREINTRFENNSSEINARFENLWITMLGGFVGVMAFIGGLVFWDRKTLVKHAKTEFRDEIGGDRRKLDAILQAMRKLSPQFPEVREVLKSFGLL